MNSCPMEKPDRRFLLKSARWTNVGLVIFVLTLTVFLFFNTAYASGGGGEAEGGRNWSNFFWRAFNFAVLAGLLYWLLVRKVNDFFGGRRQDIKIALAEAVAAREEAEEKFQEYDAKLDRAREEIKAMAEMLDAQGLAEKERIIGDARKAAVKMKEDAQKRMEQEMEKARYQLRAEAVRLSVEMAEEILKKQITAADHAGMVENYIDKVVTKH
jgi:F-type H+-transporting ATPase subunit b